MSGLVDIRIQGNHGPIRLSDWLEIIRRDPELDLVHTLTGRNPRTGAAVDVDAPNTARWTGHPDSIAFFLQFEGGEIVSSWADRHVLAKAMTLASLLDAEVHQSLE